MSEARTVQEHRDDAHDAHQVLFDAEQEYVEAAADYRFLTEKWQDAQELRERAKGVMDRAAAVYAEAFETVNGCPLPNLHISPIVLEMQKQRKAGLL